MFSLLIPIVKNIKMKKLLLSLKELLFSDLSFNIKKIPLYLYF